jgi:3-dehydroquinate synthase
MSLPQPISAQTRYPIYVQQGILDQLKDFIMPILEAQKCSRVVVITDDTVAKHYAERALLSLNKIPNLAGPVKLIHFKAGEPSKCQATVTQLQHQLLDAGFKRDSLIIALGGGVTGDMAGFVAATYMRGIPFVQVPTSLLAMVDSSVGGKTGINTPHGKNLIGTFWQPEAVIIDPKLLNTLSDEHLISGLIEALKMFITHDAEAFGQVDTYLDEILSKELNLMEQIIIRAIQIKADVVSRDEREKGERMTLNFGHTVGHALELISKFKILHGIAVGHGIMMETLISHIQGHLPEGDLLKIHGLFHRMHLRESPFSAPGLTEEMLWESMALDKKNRDNRIFYVALEKIGQVKKQDESWATEITPEDFTKAMD